MQDISQLIEAMTEYNTAATTVITNARTVANDICSQLSNYIPSTNVLPMINNYYLIRDDESLHICIIEHDDNNKEYRISMNTINNVFRALDFLRDVNDGLIEHTKLMWIDHTNRLLKQYHDIIQC